jgi:uncharacterized repeat protein (TIGR01451 family)
MLPRLPRLRPRFVPLALALCSLPAPAWSRAPLDRLPMTFVPSADRGDGGPRFEAHTLGGTLFFTPTEVVLALPRTPSGRQPATARDLSARAGGGGVPVSVVRLRFLDAATRPRVEGAARLPGLFNEFRGSDPARWRTRLPGYGGVVYRDLYPGIDLHYEGVEGRIKGSYVVAPGADPARIRWTYAGAKSTRVDEAGNLLIALRPASTSRPAGLAAPGSVVMEQTPVAWQDGASGRAFVPVRYVVSDHGSIGFALPAGYDAARPLVLDPTLAYSSYLGGGGEDVGYAVAVDATGTYVAGYTLSTDFPTAGAVDPGCGTDGTCDGFAFYDAFVTKMDTSQTGSASLVFSTYLGGGDDDYGVRIAVDGAGASYVTGLARAGFPTTGTAFQASYGGAPGADAFLTKLSADGSQLLYSTYLGGTGGDGAWGLALDGSNHAYLAGQTASADFPTTPGVLDAACGADGACDGTSDVFVARLDPAASGPASLVFATYLGGSGEDQAFGLARDAAGNLYATGRTLSTDFPMAGLPYQTSSGGGYDAFVVKLGPGATALAYSTYLGGSGYDDGYSVAAGPASSAYVAGTTSSFVFPTTGAAFQTGFAGVYDAWFARVDATAAGAGSLVYSTYLGGGDDDEGFGLALDGAGVASLAGFTRSADFPTPGGAFQPVNGGAWDAFVVKVDPAASGAASLPYGTYLGGLGTDAAYGVALDPSQHMHLTGQTLSANFPGVGAYQGSHQGNSDVFVAVVDGAATAAGLGVAQADAPDPGRIGTDLTYTVTVQNAGPDAATGVRLTDVVLGDALFVSATPTQGACTAVSFFAQQDVSCQLGTLASGASATVDVVVNPGGEGTITSNASVSSNVSDPNGVDNAALETSTVVDVIFADGFESGDTSRWSAVSGDGDLAVTGAAALAGTAAGLQAVIDDTASLHVEDHTPEDETRYRARFYFDPNGFDPGTAQGHFRTRILLALEDGPTRRLVAIVLRLLEGQYAVRARVRQDDGTVTDTPFVTISDAPHVVEFDWVRASAEGAGDGSFQLWLDDTWVAELTGLDTDAHTVDTARLGALSVKSGASGTLFFDQFASRRLGYIGP